MFTLVTLADDPEVMDGGKMDVNSNSAFENFMGQHNLDSDEEAVEDYSVEDDIEVVLDRVRKYLSIGPLFVWLQQEKLKDIKSI